MVPDKYKGIFKKMRALKIEGDPDIINVPEPGLFRDKTKILFIGINPGYPKPDLIPSDKVLVDPKSSDDEFHAAYEISQKSWKFHDFIANFCKFEDASILNICHFPTKFNNQPSLKAVEACKPVFAEAIDAIKPEKIICMGVLPNELVSRMKIPYKVIKSYHYSYLLRKGKDFYSREVKRIKEEIENVELN